MNVVKCKPNATDVLQLRFRWVSLQLRYICALRTESLIEKRLGELPATLRDLYQETYVNQLGGHVEEQRLIAETIFRLLLCLREPLTTRNFLLAIEFCGEERTPLLIETVLDLFANFVVLDTELDVFRFAHLSVREFLEKKEGFEAASNHAVAAEYCLRYLLNVEPRYEVKTEDGWMTEHDEVPSEQHRAAFRNVCHEYACLYWLFHLNESSTYRNRPPLNALFWTFMLDDQNSVTPSCMYWVALFHGEKSLDNWYNIALTDGIFYVFDVLNSCKFACLMLVASAWNFCDVLQYCISMDPHIVRQTLSWSRTPLHIACRYGNVDAAELLIDNGSEMERKTFDRCTPVREALDHGNTKVIRLLLEKGANPNSEPDNNHDTYLRKAARCGLIGLVKDLLDAGADLDRTGKYAETALDAAIHNGDVAMVKLMLESRGRTNEITNIPLIKATQLIRAVLNGDEAVVGATLRERRITDMFAKYSNVALWSAARFNKGNCMQLLLQEGADVNFQYHGLPVLFAAAMSTSTYGLDEENCPLVESLLRQGADPNVFSDSHEVNRNLLHWAIWCKKFGLAHILLEQGADINRDDSGTSPLIQVACCGSLRAAEFLLQRGADIEKTGYPALEDPKHVRHSPLYCARHCSQRDIVQLLLQYGAKDGPDSKPHQHEPGDCPRGRHPGACPNEWGRVTDAAQGTEGCNSDEAPSNKVLDDRNEVS